MNRIFAKLFGCTNSQQKTIEITEREKLQEIVNRYKIKIAFKNRRKRIEELVNYYKLEQQNIEAEKSKKGISRLKRTQLENLGNYIKRNQEALDKALKLLDEIEKHRELNEAYLANEKENPELASKQIKEALEAAEAKEVEAKTTQDIGERKINT